MAGNTTNPEIPYSKLESYVRGRTAVIETPVTVGEGILHITHPASADALFTDEEFAQDERIPYWADIWPSAISLARRLSNLDLSGRRTIELGCGVGLPSVVALSRGADILATDHYPEALDFASYNAKTNTGRHLETSVFDWNDPDTIPSGTFDLILAADVLYERRNVPVMVGLVQRLLSENGEMLLADPARPGGSFFIEEMGERGFSVMSEETSVRQDERNVPVMVYRITRSGPDSASVTS